MEKENFVCNMFKLEKSRFYSLDVSEFRIFYEFIDTDEMNISRTTGKSFYRKYHNRIDNTDGDNINTWKDLFIIKIERKIELQTVFNFVNTYLLLFDNELKRDDYFDAIYYKYK
jgi:hypothetical protein